ncbi:uncharacterized protein CANTADRAFT_5639 [Suhomyces tanzawaensis NRRL Y-17324]|uniref:KOW domain-containing protein n=1 Tax=Suhomyces tanzawaensis NRRL Y-17324 TaxID=984487 RepID=A0A1E4SKJ3_9ASCO|nr:uncharacterized protein CANTADRAFT_5639 [Suhomyces tanzawaensis NRRL Y-17324]ODV79957.1 hypothetical protein CANTADRAFT_5639 [Suhomyces tanzawaensis NRRL Y-17324]
MSWNTAKKRLTRDIEGLPKRLRDHYQREAIKYALPTFDVQTPPLLKNKDIKSLHEIGITEGDLIYITEGENKGTVTTVTKYLSNYDSFVVTNSTSKRLFQKSNWVEGQTSHVIDFPNFIPRSHVRLAGKEKDESGATNYLVADKVVLKDKYYDDRYKKWLPRRYVKHHETIEIPWPNPPGKLEEGELSTEGDAVLDKTYELQTIAKPPVPAEALAQLRNPHSKYKKRVLSELQARRLKAPEMPLSTEQKIYLAKNANKPKKTYTNLSPEIEDFIGSKMAEHISKIDNPAMLTHLEALSKSTIPDFEKTMKNIKESEQA